MITAYDYPLLGIMWTLLAFFVLFTWIMCLFYVIGDLMRAKDIGGGVKAIWAIVVLLLPFFGIFLYLCVRGRHMAENTAQAIEARQAELDASLQESAGSGGPSTGDQLARLIDLRDSGAITAEEFEAGKAKILT